MEGARLDIIPVDYVAQVIAWSANSSVAIREVYP